MFSQQALLIIMQPAKASDAEATSCGEEWWSVEEHREFMRGLGEKEKFNHKIKLSHKKN